MVSNSSFVMALSTAPQNSCFIKLFHFSKDCAIVTSSLLPYNLTDLKSRFVFSSRFKTEIIKLD